MEQEELKSLVEYREDTGKVTWLYNSINTAVGYRAGYKAASGYRYITVNKKRYLEHRLIWFYMTGKFPDKSIDHINRVKDDNRWCNLRLATPKEQNQNLSDFKNNTSGTRGIYYHIRDKRWTAYIRIDGKSKHLGNYKTKEEAIIAREVAIGTNNT